MMLTNINLRDACRRAESFYCTLRYYHQEYVTLYDIDGTAKTVKRHKHHPIKRCDSIPFPTNQQGSNQIDCLVITPIFIL